MVFYYRYELYGVLEYSLYSDLFANSLGMSNVPVARNTTAAYNAHLWLILCSGYIFVTDTFWRRISALVNWDTIGLAEGMWPGQRQIP